MGGTWTPESPPCSVPVESKEMRVVLHFHGGAYILGNGRDGDTGFLAQNYIKHGRFTHVFTPQYRLATGPHGRFPAALQDSLSAYLHLVNTLKISPQQIVVGGDSAGGNIVMALLRYIFHHGEELAIPWPAAVLLWSPWTSIATSTDASAMRASPNYATDYIPENFPLWGVHGLTGGGRISPDDPYLSPGDGHGFKSPAPIWVNTGRLEALHSANGDFVETFKKAGTEIEWDVDENCPHDIGLMGRRFKFATSWKWMRMKAVVGGVDLRDGGIEDDFEACFDVNLKTTISASYSEVSENRSIGSRYMSGYILAGPSWYLASAHLDPQLAVNLISRKYAKHLKLDFEEMRNTTPVASGGEPQVEGSEPTSDVRPPMSKQTHTVRKATLSDAPEIASLGAEVFRKTFGHSAPEADVQNYIDENYSVEGVTAHLQHSSRETLVAVDAEGRVKGYATLTKGTSEPCVDDVPDKAELQRLYVDASALGMGIGGLLERAVEDLAREGGFRHLWLGVWEENHVAKRAYEKWGYKRVGEHTFYLGSDAQTDYVMLKAL
ncbi:hypothetical protein SAPIO_CDS6925 [Scedosporium apiospermum]|uniref:N-acetyltransferase domain-containing protein n=1 Tax=Pseudallescheria apiosperma TaxID=563466 RepID=A0A084G320_PSEDA|nr:uncharacterized protein SAPIO_CDS6925 [Scedosporium apiospermum]KEZ41732.1 hypothetical protein SAPIO_CDS6925 [Scedosporium apiospermum]